MTGPVARGNSQKRFGAYCFDLYAIDAGTSPGGASGRAQFLDWMYDAGVGTVALQCFDGDYLGDPDGFRFQDVMGSWRDDIRARGMDFAIWGVHHADVPADVDRADEQVQLWEPDLYIADAELEYKSDSGGDITRSAAWVSGFRAAHPHIKLALTSYGAAPAPNTIGHVTLSGAPAVFDYKSWFDAGAHFHPQAYPNQDPIYDIVECARHALRAGWPWDRVEMIVGIWAADREFDGADYVQKMLATHADLGGLRSSQPETTYGCWAFLADDWLLTDWQDFGAGVAAHAFAEPRDRDTYGGLVYSR